MSGPTCEPGIGNGPLQDMLKKIQQDWEKAGKDLLRELWKVQEEIDQDLKKGKPF